MTLQATFAATLVDEWVRSGVTDAVVAPGSRSSPLALALLADARMSTHVRLDERSAGFFALGIAQVTGEPVVVLTTSGTAAAELHATVAEADLARVPVIVVTADRPFELHGVGAPQTIEQVGLYGGAVRFFADTGVPDADSASVWRSLASRAVAEARTGPRGPGPVHLNVPFREPLEGEPDGLPPGRAGGEPWHRVVAGSSAPSPVVDAVAELTGDAGRVFVLAGGPQFDGAERLLAATARLGWPVASDARAFARGLAPTLIAHADGIVRSAAARVALQPTVVVRLGTPPASKVLATWCATLGASRVASVLVDPAGSFDEPERLATLVVRADPGELFVALADAAGRPAPDWLGSWREADDAAEAAVAAALDAEDKLSEPGVARRLFARAADDAVVVVASSMPVRDLEWYAGPRAHAPTVISNRGANGIDGTTSTILGAARAARRSGRRTYGLLGDLAFLHDLSGLVFGAAEELPDATLVVVDNAGGGIFSFLAYPGAVSDDAFTRALATPQRPDVASIAASLGASVREVAEPGEFDRALRDADDERGISVVVVRSDRAANVAAHESLNAAVTAAVERRLGI